MKLGKAPQLIHTRYIMIPSVISLILAWANELRLSSTYTEQQLSWPSVIHLFHIAHIWIFISLVLVILGIICLVLKYSFILGAVLMRKEDENLKMR